MPLNDFEIGKLLGKGAFGSVMIVKRKEDEKIYAMKRVKIVQLSPKEKENAFNEVRILASLSHQNIIGYKEAFFDDPSQTLNIIMEFADDGDLASKIKDNAQYRLSFHENTIWQWLIQIIQGLQYLHDNKIMHRDLKSANIFLMKNGTIKLGDLNVSKIAKLGMAYTQTGTPYYASPEIWKDQPYDYKCDIWSVGCIIYELCTMKPPFRGTSLQQLNENIKRGVYESIPSIYSNDLAKVIGLMLTVDPNRRPNSCQLLNCDIIIKKIKEIKIEAVSSEKGKVNLMKTIKLPKDIRDINKELPKKRYNKIREVEMLENDEYETKKNFYKQNGNENQVKPIIYDNRNSNADEKKNKLQSNASKEQLDLEEIKQKYVRELREKEKERERERELREKERARERERIREEQKQLRIQERERELREKERIKEEQEQLRIKEKEKERIKEEQEQEQLRIKEKEKEIREKERMKEEQKQLRLKEKEREYREKERIKEEIEKLKQKEIQNHYILNNDNISSKRDNKDLLHQNEELINNSKRQELDEQQEKYNAIKLANKRESKNQYLINEYKNDSEVIKNNRNYINEYLEREKNLKLKDKNIHNMQSGSKERYSIKTEDKNNKRDSIKDKEIDQIKDKYKLLLIKPSEMRNNNNNFNEVDKNQKGNNLINYKPNHLNMNNIQLAQEICQKPKGNNLANQRPPSAQNANYQQNKQFIYNYKEYLPSNHPSSAKDASNSNNNNQNNNILVPSNNKYEPRLEGINYNFINNNVNSHNSKEKKYEPIVNNHNHYQPINMNHYLNKNKNKDNLGQNRKAVIEKLDYKNYLLNKVKNNANGNLHQNNYFQMNVYNQPQLIGKNVINKINNHHNNREYMANAFILDQKIIRNGPKLLQIKR